MDMMLEQFKIIFDRPEKIKKLRETILDLAVRGKLVDQDPNDEPASVLLERIKEEKERLIKDKKIKKEKPLADIDEEEKYFELPIGWQWCRLGRVSRQITDGAHKTPKYIEEGVPFLSIKNISKGYFDFSDVKFISKDEHESLIKRCKPEVNDLLFCRIGTLGKFKVIDIKEEFSIFVSLGLIKLFDNIYPKYMECTLNSPFLYRQYNKIKVDGSHTSKLNLTDIPKLVIPIPPLEEQKRIVEKVDSLMDFCDRLENILKKKVYYGELSAKSIFNAVGNVSSAEELEETLRFILLNFKELSLGDNAVKELKNCILQLAVQGKLVPQDPNDEPAKVLLEKIREEKERLIKEKKIKKEKPLLELSEEEKNSCLPKGWMYSKLGNISIIGTGSTPLKSNTEYYENGDIPWITSSATGKDYIDSYDQCITSKALEECSLTINSAGTLIVAMYGQGKTRGQVSELLIDATTNQACASINLYNKDMKKYVKLFLKKIYLEIRELAAGGAQPNLNLIKIKNYIIPLPPLAEQKRIVEKVDLLMKLCDELEKRIEKQKEYSDRLMESILKSSLLS